MMSCPTDGPIQREELAIASTAESKFQPEPLRWLFAMLFRRKPSERIAPEPFEEHIDGLA